MNFRKVYQPFWGCSYFLLCTEQKRLNSSQYKAECCMISLFIISLVEQYDYYFAINIFWVFLSQTTCKCVLSPAKGLGVETQKCGWLKISVEAVFTVSGSPLQPWPCGISFPGAPVKMRCLFPCAELHFMVKAGNEFGAAVCVLGTHYRLCKNIE